MIAINIEPALEEELRTVCKRRQIYRSRLIQELIRAYLREEIGETLVAKVNLLAAAGRQGGRGWRREKKT